MYKKNKQFLFSMVIGNKEKERKNFYAFLKGWENSEGYRYIFGRVKIVWGKNEGWRKKCIGVL